MPKITPEEAAVYSAGAQVLSSGINAYSTAKSNRKGRQFAQHMYDIQRRDALADYERINAYNHPSAQMARLREAGLNPNLVYGNGATTESSSVRSSSAPSWSPHAPQIDTNMVGDAIGTMYDVKVKDATIANMNLAGQNTEAETELKKAQLLAVLAGIPGIHSMNIKKEADALVASSTTGSSIEAKNLQVDKIKSQIKNIDANTEKTLVDTVKSGIEGYAILTRTAQYVLESNAKINKLVQETLSLKYSREEIQPWQLRKLRQEYYNLDLDKELKDMELNMRKQNKTSYHDNVIYRNIVEYIQNIKKNLGGGYKW